MAESKLSSDDQFIVEKALKLSLIEVGIGSLLHNFKVPLTGHWLSLNQGMFLIYFQKHAENRWRAAKMILEISLVAAILKSLAPTAKKLGPMISISTQGFLLSLGLLLFGQGLTGQMLGMALLSLWAFVQPLVSFLIIHGFDLIGAAAVFIKKLQDSLAFFGLPENLFLTLVTAIILFKVLVACLIPIALRKWGARMVGSYDQFLDKLMASKSTESSRAPVSATRGAMRDLLRPSVLLSFVLMVLFFYWNESDHALIFWRLLRSLAIAFLLFFCARSPLIKKFLSAVASKHPAGKRLFVLAQNVSSELNRKLGN